MVGSLAAQSLSEHVGSQQISLSTFVVGPGLVVTRADASGLKDILLNTRSPMMSVYLVDSSKLSIDSAEVMATQLRFCTLRHVTQLASTSRNPMLSSDHPCIPITVHDRSISCFYASLIVPDLPILHSNSTGCRKRSTLNHVCVYH
jgi:hypothetical protein